MTRDDLRFTVVHQPEQVGNGTKNLIVSINDADVTRLAGLAMPAVTSVFASGLLDGTDPERHVPLARCGCGDYGCAMTAVRVKRSQDVVTWEWVDDEPLYALPMQRPAIFDANHYDRELQRIRTDRSWREPVDDASIVVVSRLWGQSFADGRLQFRNVDVADDGDGLNVAVYLDIVHWQQLDLPEPITVPDVVLARRIENQDLVDPLVQLCDMMLTESVETWSDVGVRYVDPQVLSFAGSTWSRRSDLEWSRFKPRRRWSNWFRR